jgi:hypothetical protein
MTINTYFTSTSGVISWIVPSDWNNSNNYIAVIGAGGGASCGGGGGFAASYNVSLVPGSTIHLKVGPDTGPVGQNSWINIANGGSTQPTGTGQGVLATGGSELTGLGGVGVYGQILYTGGRSLGEPGGGAAGPHGNGRDGNNTIGGVGDAGYGGSGGYMSGGYTATGTGGSGTEWGSYGAGGGGGYYAGGLYGGGGGSWGAGGQGLCLVSYTPAPPPPPPPANGRIIFVKTTQDRGTGLSSFSPVSFVLNLLAANATTFSNTFSVSSFTNTIASAISLQSNVQYTFSEGTQPSGPAGTQWEQASLVCVDSANNSLGTTFTLQPSQNVYCIATNRLVQQNGTINFVKTTQDEGTGQSSFSSVGFTLQLTGLGVPTISNTISMTGFATNTHTISAKAGIQYSFSEGAQPTGLSGAQWQKVSLQCTDAGNSAVLGTVFTLLPGQTVNCIATDKLVQQNGTINFVKVVVDNETDLTSFPSTSFILNIQPSGGQLISRTISRTSFGSNLIAVSAAAGTRYSFSESAQPVSPNKQTKWQQVSLQCRDGSSNADVGTIFTLQAGQTVNCVATDELVRLPPGTINFVKVAQDSGTGLGYFPNTGFTLDIQPYGGDKIQEVMYLTSFGTAVSSIMAEPGIQYTFSEDALPPAPIGTLWNQLSLRCVDASTNADLGTTFTLQPSQFVNCIATNQLVISLPPPPPPPPNTGGGAVCSCLLPIFDPNDTSTGLAKHSQYYWAYGSWSDAFASATHYDDSYNKLLSLSTDNNTISLDNSYDTLTSWSVINEQENPYIDYPRVWKSRSNEWVDDNGQRSVWCRHRVALANTLCLPYSEPSLGYATCTTNLLYMNEQTKGYRLAYRANTGIFSPGDVVAQVVNENTTVYGTVYQMDQNYIWINITVGKFFGGMSVYNSNNPTVNAFAIDAVHINEKYSSNVFIGQSRYITKSTVLAAGHDSEDLKVYMGAYRPANANFNVYAKVISGDDQNLYKDRIWTELVESNTTSTLFSSTTNLNDFVDLVWDLPISQLLYGNIVGCSCESNSIYLSVPSTDKFYTGELIYLTDLETGAFNVRGVAHIVDTTTLQLLALPSFSCSNVNVGIIPDLNDTTGAFLYDRNNNAMRYVTADDIFYDSFNQFAVKIVPISDNPVVVPRATDLRVLALQT